MTKYKVVYISGVATAIGIEKSPGYHECVLNPIFPSDEEIASMSKSKSDKWTKKNNAFMEAVCEAMNQSEVKL